ISAQVQEALEGVGLVMPDVTQGADSAKAAFRALFETLDPTTEAGQQAVAAMLGVNQAFAQLVDGLDEMASAAEQAALKARQAAWETLVSAGESAFAALTRSVSAEKTRLQKESEAI